TLGRAGERRLPEAPPAGGCRGTVRGPHADRRLRLPKPFGAAGRWSAGRRERSVGLPARGGAPRSRTRGRPVLRPGTLGPAAAGRSRHRVVAERNGVPEPGGRGADVAAGPVDREPARNGPRRRARSAPSDPARDGRDARRAVPRGGWA